MSTMREVIDAPPSLPSASTAHLTAGRRPTLPIPGKQDPRSTTADRALSIQWVAASNLLTLEACGPFGGGLDLEADRVALIQGLVSFTLDRRGVDEHIRAFFGLDESEALLRRRTIRTHSHPKLGHTSPEGVASCVLVPISGPVQAQLFRSSIMR